MNSFLSWVGGKMLLRDIIIARFPCSFTTYAEVFCGAAWVFFRKTRSKNEAINDMNNNLANLYWQVQENADALCERLRYAIDCEANFYRIRDALKSGIPRGPRRHYPRQHPHDGQGRDSRPREIYSRTGGNEMKYIINVLEPKTWDEQGSPDDMAAPKAFRQGSKLSQHISFLRDFFRSYKDFTDAQTDTIELMLEKLYARFGISDAADFRSMRPTDYPILSDLYALIEDEYKNFDESKRQLYTAESLREICLGLHSMCLGAESKFFNGHTNISSNRFLTFGVKGLLQASRNIKNNL